MRLFCTAFLLVLALGCSTTNGLRRADFTTPITSPDVLVYGHLDRQHSSDYFGVFEFVFKNRTERWLKLENVRVSFKDDSASKYINVADKEQLVQWLKVIPFQKRLTRGSLEESILSIGTGLTGLAGLLAPAADALGLEPDEASGSTYPDNHLYADQLVVPPGLITEKWILFVSRKHGYIPYVTELFLDFESDGTQYETRLHFREPHKGAVAFDWKAEDPNRWRLSAGAYLVMNRVDADQTLGDTELPLDFKFDFPLDNPEFGFHLEAHNSRFGALFDIVNIDVTDKLRVPPELEPNAESFFDFDISALELLGFYRYNQPNWSFDFLGGLRYNTLKFEPKFSETENPTLTKKIKESWFDPVVGGRLTLNVTPRFSLTARGDLGGFGIGSDIALNSQAGLGYRLTRRTHIFARFHQLSTRYDTGKKNQTGFFLYDGSELRILLGTDIHF